MPRAYQPLRLFGLLIAIVLQQQDSFSQARVELCELLPTSLSQHVVYMCRVITKQHVVKKIGHCSFLELLCRAVFELSDCLAHVLLHCMTETTANNKCSCDQILPGLYLGPVEAEQADLEPLQQLGITHVLRIGCSLLPKTHEQDLKYLEVDVWDLPEIDLLSAVKSHNCLEYIHHAREAGGILVHCIAGVSRSATVVTAYIMCKDHMSFREALALVKARRPRASPNSGFCEQLKYLEVECDCKIVRYARAPAFPYLTPAERKERDRQWLSQRQAAISGVAAAAPGPWKVNRTKSVLPPPED